MTTGFFMGMASSRANDPARRGYLGGTLPNEDGDDGRTRIKNVPGVVRVNVYERGTMRLVETLRSAADGSWRVDYLDQSEIYVVIGFDDQGRVNAAIQDWVRPALMD
jgi:hypothetical protein